MSILLTPIPFSVLDLVLGSRKLLKVQRVSFVSLVLFSLFCHASPLFTSSLLFRSKAN